jgi:hypothetical protein
VSLVSAVYLITSGLQFARRGLFCWTVAISDFNNQSAEAVLVAILVKSVEAPGRI